MSNDKPAKQKRNRKKGGFAIAIHNGEDLQVIIRDLENAAAAKSALRKRVNAKEDPDDTEYAIVQIKQEHLTPRVETRIVWK